MAYLFDTDTISAVLRPRPDLGVARRLATVAADKQFTSAITLGELLFGALRRQRADLIERIQAIADTVPVLPSTSQPRAPMPSCAPSRNAGEHPSPSPTCAAQPSPRPS